MPRWDKSGIWEGLFQAFEKVSSYKYRIHGYKGAITEKGDPFGNYWEKSPDTATITWDFNYQWQDEEWMQHRKKHNALDAPWSVYEVHLASWMRPDKNNENAYNTYDQIAERLVPYVKEMGFTHVELMPVMEHPFDGSWGYQCTGYFAPLRVLESRKVNASDRSLHQDGIGVILDWVPSHFPYDAHGLYMFDGRTPMNMPICAKDFIPTGTAIFSIIKGEK